MSEPLPSRSYRAVLLLLRTAVRAFFRDVIVQGGDRVPRDRGGILVAWHPNGLVDPGLILTQFPRQVVFGARHGVFKIPLLGRLVKAIGTVPIYRAMDLPDQDPQARAEANRKSLAKLAESVAAGRFTALFPEGTSHDAPHLAEIKTGAARLYYLARSLQPNDAPPACIIVVGIHYDDKDLFRSNAFVEFHQPLELTASLDYQAGLSEPELDARARALTREIERLLNEVVLPTENWELFRLMHRARKLVRAERAKRARRDPGRTSMDERIMGFARIRHAYELRKESHPTEVAELVRRVDEYDEDLHALGLEDHELDRAPKFARRALAILLALQAATVVFVLPPILVVGYVVNAPTAILLLLVARAVRRHRKDEATVKLLAGSLLFPLTWIGAGIAAYVYADRVAELVPGIGSHPLVLLLLIVLLSAAGGILAVRYLRIARETLRAVRVRFTRRLRRRSLERLIDERAALHDRLLGMAEGIELPGHVLPDGRIVHRDHPDYEHIDLDLESP